MICRCGRSSPAFSPAYSTAFGSGREEGTSEKWLVEHCRVLDVGYLQREACVQGGRGRSIREIVLNYRWQYNGGEWEDIRQTVMLTTTSCHYGGLRHWFRCPGRRCGRRVPKLYLRRRYFACRKCHDLRYRTQTENYCRVLDVGYLQREACVQGGRGRSISEIVLNYRWQHNGGEWEDIRQSVMLTTTLCHYGGLRHWFRCPGRSCGRRVAKLYLRRRYFACRKCHDLRYRSQTENRANRALRVAFDIRERLGGSRTLGEAFPAKPKGMHWRTYERLRARAAEAEIVFWSGWL